MQISKILISMLSITSAFNLNKYSRYIIAPNKSRKMSTITYANSAKKYRAKKIKMQSDPKLITISPGGLLGFYMFGVSKYIKDNYKLDNSYIFSGASAGSWNSLFMTFNGNDDEFMDLILKNIPKNNIEKLENNLKADVLSMYSTGDFNLNNLYIGVSSLEKYKFKLNIYSNFTSLEEALDCCIISSHIPFVTGKPCKKYKNKFAFDGGFYEYPYTNITKPILNITPDIWGHDYPDINLFSTKDIDYNRLFLDGYEDSYKNRDILDKILL